MKFLLHHLSDGQELFWVLPDDFANDVDRLISWKDGLDSAETLKPTLWRDQKVLKLTGGNLRFHLPDEFFRMTAEELKREQERR